MKDNHQYSKIMQKKFFSLGHLIENTPLLEIDFNYKNKTRKIYAKYESLNMTGRIKDRMAYYILKKSYENGHIKEGDNIAEATIGNTGIFFRQSEEL